ncbi:putative disease resistance protein RGA3 [Cocos nucifera]|uniref:Putative disease resistance protein RGA3 n=1 Tax=Cocos nucifera TaxID=13894 RepID=A0A8K0ICI1_COCNU|nr:putative disease resistance protein RGA3 [Cocos nucifera]
MDYITQLWIAEGFVKEGSSTMEETAKEYYRELIMRNLLQPNFRMHDLLHCLARHMARDENLVLMNMHKVGGSNGLMKLRRVFVPHYKIIENKMTEILDVLVKQDSLRTLLWRWSCETRMDVVFDKLSRLRVLDVSFSEIERLPDSLGNLIYLRYLNISYTKISAIPETIGNLRNLQGLNMSYTKISVMPESIGNLRNLRFLEMRECQHLSRLPNGIVNLHNLRSLRVDSTMAVGMPAGLGKLQNLHTLREFNPPSSRAEGWCTIEELRSLSCLTDLSIARLECISSSSQARAAELANKPKLRSLSLSCTRLLQPSEEQMRRIAEVFEELHPPPCLEELQIIDYFAREFPKWMTETSSSTSILFPNLRQLVLNGCRYCERLPPCGLLPNLEHLAIWDAASVIDVGPEFLVGTSSTSSGSGRAAVDTSKYAFPRLETLVFRCFPNWQEWHWDKGTQAMPSLNYLWLDDCPKLMSLPEGLLLHATSLTKLEISFATSLTTIENLLSLKELIITVAPNLEKVSDLPALTTLLVAYCQELRVVENLQSLKRMKLINYDMKSLPSYLLKGVQRGIKKRKRVEIAHLEKLEIMCSSELARNICHRAGPEWPKIQDIQQVRVSSLDGPVLDYNKSPFSLTTEFKDTSSSSSGMPSNSSGINP